MASMGAIDVNLNVIKADPAVRALLLRAMRVLRESSDDQSIPEAVKAACQTFTTEEILKLADVSLLEALSAITIADLGSFLPD